MTTEEQRLQANRAVPRLGRDPIADQKMSS
jgi:hypothetical protein